MTYTEDYTEEARRIRLNALSNALQKCPKCSEMAIFWNPKGEYGEGCFECIACCRTYVTEYDLIAAVCNAVNELRYKDSQRFSS